MITGDASATALAIAALPPTVIQSNVIQDEAPVVDAIRKLVAETKTQARQVITAVPGPAVIVKKVILPAQTGATFQASVSSGGIGGDFQSLDPAFSRDGKWVYFSSSRSGPERSSSSEPSGSGP